MLSSRYGLVAVLFGCSCAGAVPLSSDERGKLESRSNVPVVYEKSEAPWVYCPTDAGRSTWEGAGAMNGSPAQPIPSESVREEVLLASAVGPPTFIQVGDFWDLYEEQATESLRVPPEDPAQATARHFLALAGAGKGPMPFRDEASLVEKASPQALAESFGPGPVLILKTSEWMLVGCYSTYSPWFSVRGELLDTSTGNVLWRDSCHGHFPSTFDRGASELAANGGAMYARVIEERATQCSQELFKSIALAGGDRAPSTRESP